MFSTRQYTMPPNGCLLWCFHLASIQCPLTVASSDVFNSPVNSCRRKSPLSEILPNHDSWISRQSTQHYQYNTYIFVTNGRDEICTAECSVTTQAWALSASGIGLDQRRDRMRWLSQITSHFNTDTHTAINYFCPQIRYRVRMTEETVHHDKCTSDRGQIVHFHLLANDGVITKLH